MAIRKKLFNPMEGEYGEDCIIPLDILLQGYRVVHEPEVVAYDKMESSIEGELATRIRMTLRNWTGTLSRKELLNPLRYPPIAWTIVSHKLLRWLTPFFLIGLFLSNIFLLSKGSIYQILFILQILFYLFALIGLLSHKYQTEIPIISSAFSFCLANVGFLIGVFKAFKGESVAKYEVSNSN
jgi:hypothetical protein